MWKSGEIWRAEVVLARPDTARMDHHTGIRAESLGTDLLMTMISSVTIGSSQTHDVSNPHANMMSVPVLQAPANAVSQR